MGIQSLLKKWVAGQSASVAESEAVMQELLTGEVPDGVIGAFLALSAKVDLQPEELAGLALGMRSKMSAVPNPPADTVDTCGTGGGRSTINLSTGAAIIASAAGATIAKHGNRGVTSACGSADVLESLGVNLTGTPEQLSEALHQDRIAFLFAQNHHPAMRFVGPTRRALGFRTVFNLLGPLSNPAGANRQVVGVYDPRFVELVAKAMVILGVERAFVVHSPGDSTDQGLDEINPCGKTLVAEVRDGGIQLHELTPSNFGLEPLHPDDLLPSETVAENAQRLKLGITNAESKECAAMLPNAAAALVLAGIATDLTKGAELARSAVAHGAAAKKLESMIQRSQA